MLVQIKTIHRTKKKQQKQTNKRKTVRIDPLQMMDTYLCGLTIPHLSFICNCLYKYFELCLEMWKTIEVTFSRFYLMTWSEKYLKKIFMKEKQ